MQAPRYDHLFVVSDLHLGGRKEDLQIFNQRKALSWLIETIRRNENKPEEQVALVLNGDVVDFLAEAPGRYLDTVDAEAKLNRIITDPNFSDVWKSLAKFVHTPKRRLVIVMGNHDVELSLPGCRQLICQYLAGDDEAAAGRLGFAVDGNGHFCRVGGAEVLCLHGNEFDNWNMVDTFALDKMIRALNRKAPLPEWSPNAGTRMVVDVMNDIKRKMRWIDLLKPEDMSLIALLVILSPDSLSKLRELPAIAETGLKYKMRRMFGFLSAEEEEKTVQQEKDALRRGRESVDLMLRDTFFGQSSQKAARSEVDRILEEAEKDREKPFWEETIQSNDMLGFFGAIMDKICNRSEEENMRDALLKWYREKGTFKADTVDDTFKKIDEECGPGLDFVVAGHTHLHRALKRKNGSGFYYNSGTWIRLMELTPEMLNDRKIFSKVWDALKDGSMSALDNVKIINTDKKLVRNIRTVVDIQATASGSARGCLQTVEKKDEGNFELREVEKTAF